MINCGFTEHKYHVS